MFLYTAFLSPPFLLTHRRSRTQSSIQPTCPPVSATTHGTPARRTLGILNTPPPKPTNATQLKFKGCLTDPAHTRRRPPFGQVCVLLLISYPIHFTVTRAFCANSRYPLSFSTLMRMLLNRIHNLFPLQLRHSCYKTPSTPLGSQQSQSLSHSISQALILKCSASLLLCRHKRSVLSAVAQVIGWRFSCRANIYFAPLA